MDGEKGGVLSAAVTTSFRRRPIVPRQVYHPNWDVREDNSLYADVAENDGILTYLILKGLQLLLDRPICSLMTPAARLAVVMPTGAGCASRTVGRSELG